MPSIPPPPTPGRVTEILARIRAGEASADDLIPLVYDELRLLARRCRRWQGMSGTRGDRITGSATERLPRFVTVTT